MASVRKGQKMVLVMVGLPARGKSFTARRLARYLSWLGYPTRVFNLGEQRRTELGGRQTHEFFDPSNEEGRRIRQALAQQVLEELVLWLRANGRVAIYDATNHTRARRQAIRERCETEGFAVQFIEVENDDPRVIDANVRETKLSSPDYADMDPEAAVRDFRLRIAHYAAGYEKVADAEGSYLRIVDRGRQVVMNQIDGYLPSRIVFFLSNLQITTRSIFLTRHGESEYNVEGLIGGDSGLSPQGRRYAQELSHHMRERLGETPFEVWTSTLRRTRDTAAPLGRPVAEWRSLDEIEAGICDGFSYAQIRDKWPHEFDARQRDKLGYRYPRGESYQDVIQRLDRVIIELERYRTPVLVIGHQAVCRALYTYFMDLPLTECPHVPIPLHTVIELTPRAYGCEETRTALEPRPTNAEAPSH
ncbi:MAG: 6-phosphofructo-2-kinase/fructose-2,6-bisphosphatase [Proteobacteria bacterium]|nr:6-phosphofructo-2-kinase/fructose-2,6-bisphosphatase [Pseudomonadota bacterium]